VLLQESRREVLEVFDQTIVGLRPVHGEVKTVLVALSSVGKITAVSAVRDHKKLKILIERTITVKTLFAVSVDLIEGLTNRNTALLQLDLNEWQPVDQNRHVIAIGVTAGLFELLDHLNFVAGDILFVYHHQRQNRGYSHHGSCGFCRRSYR